MSHDVARFEARELQPRTRIAGLFLTGADVCSAGVAGAMMGGVLAGSVILKRNLLPTALAGYKPRGSRKDVALNVTA